MGVCTQPVAGTHVSVVQMLASLQLTAGPAAQTPAVQTSGAVQALPSLQGNMFGVSTHTSAPLQVPVMHGFGLGHGVPAAMNLHVAEQQSAGVPLAAPSSHCSPRSRIPLPQVCATLPMMVVNRFVETPTNPGPVTLTKFWPQLLPVTVWGETGLPIVPAGGGTGPVAKRRNGPTLPVSASENAVGTSPIGTAPIVTVSLITPRPSAVNDFTP